MSAGLLEGTWFSYWNPIGREAILHTGTPDHGHDNLITRESPDSVGQPDMLRAQSGLDESALESSEPTILRRILRSTMKGTAALEVDEKPHEGIQHDDTKRDAKIDAWIASVEQLREVENAGEVRRFSRPVIQRTASS